MDACYGGIAFFTALGVIINTKKGLRAISLVIILIGAMLAVAGCSDQSAARIAKIKSKGGLTVLTRNAPTTYYIGRDGKPTGPEYQMVKAFAKFIGVKFKFVVKDSVAALIKAESTGKGDLIAAGITNIKARRAEFDFGPSYQNVREQVVCRRGGIVPSNVAGLVGVKLTVVPDSSYAERLKSLQSDHPKLSWKTDDVGTETLLRKIWKGQLDCTVADSDIVAINRRYFPNLVVAFDLTKAQPLAWVVAKGDKGLVQAIGRWLKHYRANGDLGTMMARYYAPTKVFDYVDTRAYVRKIQNVYPKYRRAFKAAADKHDLPPLVLAAQAYQESRWDPHAVSPTGVRGMMMLTQNTAQSLGVDNRLDPRASIRGGALYLHKMEDRLPDSIKPEDRVWFALAAYNIGLAHLRDARSLAKKLNEDPDNWSQISRVLPLLSERRYYQDLPHGYARGTEPVRYVSRIRNYADILRVRSALNGTDGDS